jgi:uncharacterized protein YgfB (UPF0149 family)
MMPRFRIGALHGGENDQRSVSVVKRRINALTAPGQRTARLSTLLGQIGAQVPDDERVISVLLESRDTDRADDR